VWQWKEKVTACSTIPNGTEEDVIYEYKYRYENVEIFGMLEMV